MFERKLNFLIPYVNYHSLCMSSAWQLRWDYSHWETNIQSRSINYTCQSEWNYTIMSNIFTILSHMRSVNDSYSANTTFKFNLFINPHNLPILKTNDQYNHGYLGGCQVIIEDDIPINRILIHQCYGNPIVRDETFNNRVFGTIAIDNYV
jgi:hypothetical protein